jgi:hypothetical protein
MPALTVKAVTKALSDYVRPDEDIVAKLNMVMPRIYAMGMWRDLLYDWSIETTNDYFALPEHSESLLGAMLQNSPVDAQSQWHDYRISGYASDGPSPIFGVVDDGFHEAKEDLVHKEATDVHNIIVEPIAPNTVLPLSGEITVIFGIEDDDVAGEDTVNTHTFDLNGAASLVTVVNKVVSIKSISFSDVPEEVKVSAIPHPTDGTSTTLAVVKGDGVARYRRFRFHNSDSSTKNVKLLLKRAWQPVLTQDDILHLGNLNAIKHGLLGMLAEDNADLERAQYHWTICRQLLDEELDAARGAAKPKLTVKPAGNNFHIPNII